MMNTAKLSQSLAWDTVTSARPLLEQYRLRKSRSAMSGRCSPGIPHCRRACSSDRSQRLPQRQRIVLSYDRQFFALRKSRRSAVSQAHAAAFLGPLASTGFWGEITSNVIFMAGFWGWAVAQAVTTAIGVQHGFESSLFAMALCFSLIVMYDAAGVRRHAGAQAEVLNTVVQELLAGHIVSQRKLKEVLGHTPLQVVMGALVGVLSGVVYAMNFGGRAIVAA